MGQLNHSLSSTAFGVTAYAELNAPRALNALNSEMVTELRQLLEAWKNDPTVRCVVLSGAGGKAFSAGGDVVRVHHLLTTGRIEEAEAFFELEYSVDYLIHTYGKPIVCWADGYVLGGGLGLMAGASHRVVTERSLFAMPEISIGLFPDVGASWFFHRMPGNSGLLMALTGARLRGDDACAVGLADVICQSSSRDEILSSISRLPWTGDLTQDLALLDTLLAQFTLPRAESLFLQHAAELEGALRKRSVTELVSSLRAAAVHDQWLAERMKTLDEGSPTSTALVFEQFHRTKHLSLRECFAMDYVLISQCARRHDFIEGVRAKLVEKDNAPAWDPPTLSLVTDEIVAAHFGLPWPFDQHPFRDWYSGEDRVRLMDGTV